MKRVVSFGIFSSLAILLSAKQPEEATGQWVAKGSMSAARAGACAALLSDGRVLITGGLGPAGALDSAEFFGLSGSFSSASPMTAARSRHTCLTLPDGRVLVAGGSNDTGPISLAEIFDPVRNRWLPAGDMAYARARHSATLLQDGRVLFAGGEGPGVVHNTLEIFDPATNSFRFISTAMLSSPRKEHASALLPDGRVLIAGGSDGTNALASTDLYDPATGAIAHGAKLSAPRAGLSATKLLDGAVLVAGGSDGTEDLATAEIYDPGANKFAPAARMKTAHRGHLAFLLPRNNQVLLVGGDAAKSSAELFTPWRRTFGPTGSLQEARSEAAGAPIGLDGLLVLAGGKSKDAVLESSRIYRFATLKTDQEQYDPGATVTITGSGWQPGEKVSLLVQEVPKTHDDRTLAATADASGNVAMEYHQQSQDPGRRYYVTAVGSASEAQVRFATNPAADLDQCANGSGGPIPGTTCDWVNGNLGASKAYYREGDSVAYRLVMSSLVLGPNNVTIEWDTTQQGKHALDYLTTYNRTVQYAYPCAGIAGCNGVPSTAAIPLDPNVTANILPGRAQIPGVFTMWGGTITSISGYTLFGSYSGNSSTRITITFTATQANPVLAWGGHIASRIDWGQLNSAVSISGSPFHMRLIDLNGAGGNQDRSLSNDAVTFPGSITIAKQATPAGTGMTFGFTASPPPLTSFNLVDNGTANTTTFDNIFNFTSYNVTETSIPSGWAFDSVSCNVIGTGTTSISGPTATINLKEGDIVTCTYANHRLPATLKVIKQVITNNGGTAVASDFTMTVTGGNPSPSASFAGSDTGTTVSLDPGSSYNVTETGPSGYTASYSAGCAGLIAAGESKTCTVTNDDQPATLIVKKHVINDNSGEKTAGNFTMNVTGTNVLPSRSFAGSETGTTVTLNAGSYSVDENAVSGYTKTIGADCSGTIKNGETKTCTITNDDQAATLIVIKRVVNDSGGTKGAGDFTMNVTGTNALPSSFAGSESGTTVTLNAGSYGVDESAVSGYTKSIGATCSGTIANGETKTCTITNDDQPATLIVVKHVVNDNGGTKGAGDFAMNVAGTNVLPSPSFAGSETGTTVTLSAGSYSVDETAVSGYTKSIGATCSGTIANGEAKTCTITNDDQPATLTVVKHVVNNSGGQKTAGDFTMNLTGTNVSPSAPFAGSEAGTTVTLNAGAYSVDEVAAPGYTKIIGADCSGTIRNGEAKTCTITNDDQPGTLVVIKHVINDNGGPKTAAAFTMNVTGANVSPSASFPGSETGTTVTLNAGAYSVDEGAVLGYAKTIGTNCSGTIANGETRTCTVTNDDIAPTLTITKICVPKTDPGQFNMTISGNGGNNGLGTLACGGSSAPIPLKVNVPYTVSETAANGTSLSSYVQPPTFGGDCGAGGTVTLTTLGKSYTCVALNINNICVPEPLPAPTQ